ncbi:MAG: hypothetical protein WBQ18_16600, partial [Solirubrobacteraceae bacterium]
RRVAGKARALARPVGDRVGAVTARQIDAVVGGGRGGPGGGAENAAAQLRVVFLRIGGRVGATQLSRDDTVAGRRSPRPLLGGLLWARGPSTRSSTGRRGTRAAVTGSMS